MKLCVFASTVFYGLAALVEVVGRFRGRSVVFLLAVLFSVSVWLYRWLQVGHIPLQTMFEVFLTLGMLIGPLSWFCRSGMRMRDTLSVFADGLLGVCVLFPAVFVFPEKTRPLPPALQHWLFGPHVAVYMFAYVLLSKAAIQAAGGVITSACLREKQCYQLVRLAFPFLTMGLLLGSVWAKIAWGDWWSWDPKELWSLACWLVYVGFFHWRILFGTRFVRINLWMVLVGFLTIFCTLLWVNLSKLFSGLHNYAG